MHAYADGHNKVFPKNIAVFHNILSFNTSFISNILNVTFLIYCMHIGFSATEAHSYNEHCKYFKRTGFP